MSSTCAVPRPVACLGIALALLLPVVASAGAPAAPVNPITEGFRYHPAPDPDAIPLGIAPPAHAASRTRKRLQDPAARLPEVLIAPAAAALVPASPPATPQTPAPPAETFVLPKLTVTGQKEKPPALPRLHVDAPVKNLPTPEWESPEGLRARLVQKHFTAREQKLHSRKYLEARAAHMEAIESAGLQLNRIASAIELSALFGLEDPEAQKALQAEFLRAFYDRPR
jgi:hypothetical protein